MAYSYYRSVTVDHTKVPNTDQTDYPILFAGTYGGAEATTLDLRTVGNGGQINNTVSFNGQTVPADLAFFSDSALTSALKFDVASYTATSGQIEVWVKVPTLSHTSDTVIYLAYNDSGVTTYQGGSVGDAYDSNFVLVAHLSDGSTLSLVDSTASPATGSGTNTPTATAGQIDGAAAFASASTQYASWGTAAKLDPAAMTMQCIAQATTLPHAYNTLMSKIPGSGGGGSQTRFFQMFVKSNGKLACYLRESAGDSNYDGTGSHTVSTGVTFYAALTYNSVAGLVGYINGASDGTNSPHGTLNTNTGETQIANDQNTSGRTWDGWIDEFRVSSIARAADWITTDYNNQSSPSTFYAIGSRQSPSGATVVHGLPRLGVG